MAMRIKRLADIVETGKAEPGQERHRLRVHCAHPFEKGCSLDIGVIERSLEVIDDRKPLGGDRGSLQRSDSEKLALVALAKVVEVRQSAPKGQIVGPFGSRNHVRFRAYSDLLRIGFLVFMASR
jgi:hypothetical protein